MDSDDRSFKPVHGGPPNDEVLLLSEVAAILRLPEATLRSWRSRDLGPASFKIGRRVAYMRSDVLKWIGKQREETKRGDLT